MTIKGVRQGRILTRRFKVGMYILLNHATSREAAEEFDVSNSTIIRDIKKLEKLSPKLHDLVKDVFEANKKNEKINSWRINGTQYGKKHLYNIEINKGICGRTMKNYESEEEFELNNKTVEDMCNQCKNTLLGLGLAGEFLKENENE